MKASWETASKVVEDLVCPGSLCSDILLHSPLPLSTPLSAPGAGAAGSQAAVVSVGQELWEAGRVSACFGRPPVSPVLRA